MASSSNVQVTISLSDHRLDDEQLQAEVENLLPQLREVDGVEEADLVAVEFAPPGSKALGGFFLGVLTAKVNPAHIKAVLRWLSDRAIGKPLELSLKMPDGTEISGKATNQADKDYLNQKVDEVLQCVNPNTHTSFTQDLSNGVTLEMVAIPSGTFLMGSPESEPEQTEYERPQHTVTLQPFFMGKFPVTQAQWRVVASLPKVKIDLNPDPSNFKGANRPVEQASWYDAVEFCKRLSRQTGRQYRLPSEAKWEYACRAGTATPFHFGEAISSDLANYDGNYTYASGLRGACRKQTTDVGSFPANAFGLHDMHGNVSEWCEDTWHENYNGVPSGGSAWVNENDNQYRILRGGSWYSNPGYCRSAFRYWLTPAFKSYAVGFRVVISPPRTS